MDWKRIHQIIYTENGERSKLETGENSSDKSKEKKEQKEQKKASQDNKNEKSSANHIKKVISREEVLRVIKGNTAEIYKNAAFGPWVKDGRIQGYKITRVSRRHIFYKLGARNGDIIKKVNEHSLSNVDRLFDIWKSLPSANNVKVEILRRGKTNII